MSVTDISYCPKCGKARSITFVQPAAAAAVVPDCSPYFQMNAAGAAPAYPIIFNANAAGAPPVSAEFLHMCYCGG